MSTLGNSLDETLLAELRRVTESIKTLASALTRLKRESRTLQDTGTLHDADERVARGVAFLDERLGRRFWLERLDVDTLDVSSTYDCVVCQVTGQGYALGVEFLGGPALDDPFGRLAWADHRGFALLVINGGYADLTAAWVRAVTRLRAEAEVATADVSSRVEVVA